MHSPLASSWAIVLYLFAMARKWKRSGFESAQHGLLPHPAGEALAPLGPMRPQAEAFQQLPRPRRGLLGGHGLEAGDELQVFDRGELVIQQRLVRTTVR